MTSQEINEAVGEKLNYDCKCDEYPCVCRPDYCGDIRAAWEIIEHLKSTENCCFQLNMDDKGVGFWIGTKHQQKWYAEADTAPMAICLTFLKLEEIKLDRKG